MNLTAKIVWATYQAMVAPCPTTRFLAAACGIGLASCGPAPLLPAGIAELQLRQTARQLARTAAEEDARGVVAERGAVLDDVSHQLLMPPPPAVLVPELFDVLVALAPRMEGGAISPAWGSYVYTSYARDLRETRPTGGPRRSAAEVEHVVAEYVEFFRLRARDDYRPPTLEDAAFQDTQTRRDEIRRSR